jgi:hypothetical protein
LALASPVPPRAAAGPGAAIFVGGLPP